MAVTDAPAVTIDGVPLAASWSLTHRIALGGLAITWGRSTHLQRADPASLVLEVLDTDGQLANVSAIQGRRVTVARADGRVIFRGRVDDFDIDWAHVQDRATGIRRRVWRFTIRASDVLAELAISNLPGPVSDVILGDNYWTVERPQERFTNLLAAGANKVIDSIEWSDPYPVTETQPMMRYRTWGDKFTALEHIEGAYTAHALGYVAYDPSRNAITIGHPADTEGLELVWDGDTLDVALPDGTVIPARTIVVPDGYKARLGLDDAIDIVQILSPQLREDKSLELVDAVTEAVTARYDVDATGRREHRVSNELMFSYTPQDPDPGGGGEGFTVPFPLNQVTSGYRTEARPNHNGIDFGSGPSNTEGTPIPAAGAGTVEYVGAPSSSHGWGNYVTLNHGTVDGHELKTRYAHMYQTPAVTVGQQVTQGETLGGIGTTGNSTGNHLHWETIVDGDYMDPIDFMATYGGSDPEPNPDPDIPDAKGEWQRLLAADTVTMLDQLNGRVLIPRIRFDWRKFTYAAPVAALIDTQAIDQALYFPGSVFAVIYDAATEYQVIGGRLVYFEGWTLDATVAPAIRTRDGVTVDELVRIDAPTISDYADHLLIADLGAVTKGVTA